MCAKATLSEVPEVIKDFQVTYKCIVIFFLIYFSLSVSLSVCLFFKEGAQSVYVQLYSLGFKTICV